MQARGPRAEGAAALHAAGLRRGAERERDGEEGPQDRREEDGPPERGRRAVVQAEPAPGPWDLQGHARAARRGRREAPRHEDAARALTLRLHS